MLAIVSGRCWWRLKTGMMTETSGSSLSARAGAGHPMGPAGPRSTATVPAPATPSVPRCEPGRRGGAVCRSLKHSDLATLHQRAWCGEHPRVMRGPPSQSRPLRPCSIMSAMPPPLLPTTGTPGAIASRTRTGSSPTGSGSRRRSHAVNAEGCAGARSSNRTRDWHSGSRPDPRRAAPSTRASTCPGGR